MSTAPQGFSCPATSESSNTLSPAGLRKDLDPQQPTPSRYDVWFTVGIPVAGDPPHRSRRADFPHRALPSGSDAQAFMPLAVPSPALVATFPDPVFGGWCALEDSPWADPFPPATPPAVPRHPLCSPPSSVLRTCPTAGDRSSPHYSLDSRCGQPCHRRCQPSALPIPAQ